MKFVYHNKKQILSELKRIGAQLHGMAEATDGDVPVLSERDITTLIQARNFIDIEIDDLKDLLLKKDGLRYRKLMKSKGINR